VTLIVVIVICFFAVTTGLRAIASKRSTGRWRYRGMFKYRPDRWENRNTALWSSGITKTSDGHVSTDRDSGDSGHDDGGGS
jgi:nitrate reductase beta subunit